MRVFLSLSVRGFIFFLALAHLRCASLKSVSLTPIPAERSQEVQARASKLIILGISFNHDFLDELVEELKQQCPRGKVSGILTKDESIDYFLGIVKSRRVSATGFCVPSTLQKTAALGEQAL